MVWIVFLLLDAICIITPDELLHVVLHRRVTANTGMQSVVKWKILLQCLHNTYLTVCPSQSSAGCMGLRKESYGGNKNQQKCYILGEEQ